MQIPFIYVLSAIIGYPILKERRKGQKTMVIINLNGNAGKRVSKSVNKGVERSTVWSLFINLIKTKAVRFQSVNIMRVSPDSDFCYMLKRHN